MTDHATAYLDALPRERYEEVCANLRDEGSTFASTKLRIADPDLSRRQGYEIVEALSERLGVVSNCSKCHGSVARLRDGYGYGPLCDDCAARTAVWECPGCGSTIDGYVERAGDTCRSCEARPEWEALPQEVRDEIGAMVDAGRGVLSIYRLMELDGHTRRSIDYMRMVSYRMSLRDGLGRGWRLSVEL
ncbi:hypothetical protein ACFWN2_27685 [Lentzea sp. NPDC058436]|uniref:hypothetical protein n=1 Tax=Lentzea sp. NPDC058436 TaxID=3346499 RepID=UPI00365A1B39